MASERNTANNFRGSVQAHSRPSPTLAGMALDRRFYSWGAILQPNYRRRRFLTFLRPQLLLLLAKRAFGV